MYCAIIGDMVDSKKILDRRQAQIDLKDILGKVNAKYSSEIASGFVITLGDEFQGVLNTPKSIMNIIGMINAAIHPIKIRYGIGLGEIKTDINEEQAIGADGPAYYNARDAINNLKQNERKYETVRQLVYLKTGYYDSHVNLVNACLALCNQMESDWTEKQRRTLHLMRKNDENQSETARELGINKSSVQKSLSASKYYYYMKALQAINDEIMNIWQIYIDNENQLF